MQPRTLQPRGSQSRANNASEAPAKRSRASRFLLPVPRTEIQKQSGAAYQDLVRYAAPLCFCISVRGTGRRNRLARLRFAGASEALFALDCEPRGWSVLGCMAHAADGS